jgi:hypothetical protein
MCRPSGTRVVSLSLPGTDVPGYRLFRPCGTGSLRYPPRSLSDASTRGSVFSVVGGPGLDFKTWVSPRSWSRPKHPGLKGETWATHSMVRPCHFEGKRVEPGTKSYGGTSPVIFGPRIPDFLSRLVALSKTKPQGTRTECGTCGRAFEGKSCGTGIEAKCRFRGKSLTRAPETKQ